MIDEVYSNSSNSTAEEPEGLHPLRLLQVALFVLICLVGLIGNSLVIYVVIRFSKMQTVTNMYIVNLAVADECFLLGLPFLIATVLMKSGWFFGHFMCKLYMIVYSLNQYTSSMFILIISADRYVAVCHSIVSPRYRTPLISIILSSLAWICSICLAFPLFLYSTTTVDLDNSTHCVTLWPREQNSTEGTMESSFILYSTVLGFIVPLTLILVFYCLIVHKLLTVGPKNKSADRRKSQLKITRLVLAVVSLYLVCWTPYWTMQLLMLYSFEHDLPGYVVTINLFATCLSYSNSAANPVLYAFLSDNFRKSFMKAFTCVAAREVNKTLTEDKSVFPKKNSNAFFKSTGDTELTNVGKSNGEMGSSVEDLKRRVSHVSNIYANLQEGAGNAENVVETTSL